MVNNFNIPPEIPYIILAEDDEDDCMLFTEAFSEVGVNLRLVTVNDGLELIEYLLQVMPLLPKFLFLDLNMPKKNGFATLKELKEDERLKNIPAVIYSTSSSPFDIEKCMQLKAHLYVTKPNSFVNLKKVINKVLVTDFINHMTEVQKDNFLIFSED